MSNFNYIDNVFEFNNVNLENEELYIVTDVESNGPIPVDYSMLSFGSVAVDRAGRVYGLFYSNLKYLENASVDKSTDEFWNKTPKAYEQTLYDPIDPQRVMNNYVIWLDKLPKSKKVFVADCLFDWMFMQYYLVHFTGQMKLGFNGIQYNCLAWGVLGNKQYRDKKSKPQWTKNNPYNHPHVAINDAISEAYTFVQILNDLNNDPNYKSIDLKFVDTKLINDITDREYDKN